MNPKVAHELKAVDERILEVLADGRNTPANIGEELGHSRQWINQRLQQMESADYVVNIGRGVYELQPGEMPEEQREKVDLGRLSDVKTACEHLRRAIENESLTAAEDAARVLGCEYDE